MKIMSIVGLLATVAIAPEAIAEYYGYADQHGNMIYTKDLSQVPADKKSNVKVFRDKNNIQTTEALQETPNNAATAPAQQSRDSLKEERKQLDAQKRELDDAFKELSKENAELKQAQKMAKTRAQIRAVNKKAEMFNTRFEAYMEKKAAFKKRFEAHIQRTASENKSN